MVEQKIAELDEVVKERNHPRAGWKFTEAWRTWLRAAALSAPQGETCCSRAKLDDTCSSCYSEKE